MLTLNILKKKEKRLKVYLAKTFIKKDKRKTRRLLTLNILKKKEKRLKVYLTFVVNLKKKIKIKK